MALCTYTGTYRYYTPSQLQYRPLHITPTTRRGGGLEGWKDGINQHMHAQGGLVESEPRESRGS